MESHIYELMLQLGCHIEHLEHGFTAWLGKTGEFFIIIYRDKKLLAIFCCLIIVAFIFAKLLMLIIEFGIF